MSEAKLATLEDWVQAGLQPDLTLLFDLPVDLGRKRLSDGRSLDRFEREQCDFYERVRACYRSRAARYQDRIRLIDSSMSVEEIKKILEKILAVY